MRSFYFILISVVFFFFACDNSDKRKSEKEKDSDNSITLIDTQRNNVKLENPAQKIVCLFDPSVEIIYMLQAQDKLVGIPTETYFDNELYDYYKHIDPRILNKTLPTPGSNDLANIESIISLKPDLVIAQQLPAGTMNSLKSLNIPVYIATADTYENLIKEMRDIALLTGRNERGEYLIEYSDKKMKELSEKARLSSDKPKTVYFTWANGRIFSTAGRNSMMNNCLVLAGVENACPSDLDKPNINPETLISWNPDIIVMWNDSPDLFYDKKELKTVKAIKNKQIYNLMPMFYYNPHTFKSLCAAVAINNWAYSDNPDTAIAETKEILMELYGEETGTELIKHL